MLAEEQVLSAEDGHEIRLLGCGNYLGCSDSYPVSGILCIDNRTDEVLPYGVFSAKVNGITVDLYKSGYDSDDLPPGAKRFMKFFLQKLMNNTGRLTSDKRFICRQFIQRFGKTVRPCKMYVFGFRCNISVISIQKPAYKTTCFYLIHEA